jgi:hypothetical protein
MVGRSTTGPTGPAVYYRLDVVNDDYPYELSWVVLLMPRPA